MQSRPSALPDNLVSLHRAEESLREKALDIIANDERLKLHIEMVEAVMALADMLRQFQTDDEDLKLIQLLAMRSFNAFAASMNLTLCGYAQNAALILRDVLETAFLLDLFRGERTQIARWRLADKKVRRRDFSPLKVRQALDTRDGQTSKKRAALYELFSELAGHPTMRSAWMMRPQKDGDAVIGPFVAGGTLEAVLSEMGRLAVQIGDSLSDFFPARHKAGVPTQSNFIRTKSEWVKVFYPSHG